MKLLFKIFFFINSDISLTLNIKKGQKKNNKYTFFSFSKRAILIQGKENSGQTRQGCINCTFSHPSILYNGVSSLEFGPI